MCQNDRIGPLNNVPLIPNPLTPTPAPWGPWGPDLGVRGGLGPHWSHPQGRLRCQNDRIGPLNNFPLIPNPVTPTLAPWGPNLGVRGGLGPHWSHSKDSLRLQILCTDAPDSFSLIPNLVTPTPAPSGHRPPSDPQDRGPRGPGSGFQGRILVKSCSVVILTPQTAQWMAPMGPQTPSDPKIRAPGGRGGGYGVGYY